MKWLLALTICALATTTVRAEVTVVEFLRQYDQTPDPALRNIDTAWLNGFLAGLTWSNSYLTKARNQPRLYCPPDKLNLTAEQLVRLLRDNVEEQTKPPFNPQPYSQLPYGLALLLILQDVFPC